MGASPGSPHFVVEMKITVTKYTADGDGDGNGEEDEEGEAEGKGEADGEWEGMGEGMWVGGDVRWADRQVNT